MKVLVLGSNGMLAKQLLNDLRSGYSELGRIPERFIDAEILTEDIDTLDISDKDAVTAYFDTNRPDVVFNCAAYTNVDGCETNYETAFKANAIGPRNIAIACENIGAKLVHISTDYVFSGKYAAPRREFDLADPVSAYGKTKYAGEEYVRDFCSRYFIIRTSWLYGYYGKNFVKTMVRLCRERGGAMVVNDQHGTPTNRADLSHHMLKVAAGEEYGVYHCTGNGAECTWYDFACEIARLAGYEGVMRPCTSEEYPSPTKRPEYSNLDNMMLRLTCGDEMRDWKDALEEFFKKWNGQ
jgi:dTDP-4-dehydrorhamnose reductase